METINLIEACKSGDKRYDSYIHSFLSRFIYGISTYENIDFESKENAIILSDTYDAFTYLIENSDGYLSPTIIKNVFEIMCNSLENFVPGFRKFSVITSQGNINPSVPWAIPSDLSSLISQYNNFGDTFNQYEKEARLHIEYSRIQPFEDYNKRVGRLILSYNMIYNGHAPAIIPLSLQEEYNKAIENRDYTFLAKIIEESSKMESTVIKETFFKENFINSNDEKTK